MNILIVLKNNQTIKKLYSILNDSIQYNNNNSMYIVLKK